MQLGRFKIVRCAAGAALCSLPVSALSETLSTPNVIASSDTAPADIVVTASRADLIGIAVTASQGKITKEELRLRPAYRVGELLESVPGLVVTVHSGEGKSNQFLARGFNLDHGTDIANFIDDIPINRPTDTHGEGYSDLNFLIPEVLDGLEYTKGTYYPSVGNFGDVASVHLHIANVIPNEVTLGGDTFSGVSAYAGGTHAFGPNDRVLAAFEFNKVDGPFIPPGNFHKYAAVAKYSHGTLADGYDLTFQYYHGAGLFETDQPQRAVDRGLISRFGTLDPTDGTSNDRLSVSGHYNKQGENWDLRSSVYFVRSSQTLYNNFTHFLEDPVNGDQEEQSESRNLFGGSTSFTLRSKLGRIATETTIGLQARHDSIALERRHTLQRVVLDYCELLHADGSVTQYSVGQTACTLDRVHLYDAGLYVENTTHWLSWLRTNLGVREEFVGGSDHNLLPDRPYSVTPFTQNVTLFQPKGSVTVGPFLKTEFYYSAGRGFHSNDIRSVSGTVLLENIPGFALPTPLLVKVDSQEIGLRSDIIPKTHIQFAAFLLHVQSEQTYDQDQGEDVPGAPSRRYGFELSGQYLPVRWLELNADLSYSHARYNAASLADYGDAGPYIPNAPEFVGSFGALVDNLGPWYGGVEVRVLGSLPLISDNSARDPGYTETNVRIGYKLSGRLRAQVQVFNLLNVKANAGAYYYPTIIPGDNGVPTTDHQNHPLEPISARFSLTATF
jgi:outer membrane receptor protein involved in Fe transport